MDVLQSLLEDYNIPILSAFILGLMTAISPCPLATNITATAYISKNISSKRKVFLSGLLYSLGRGFSYTAIGLILFFGASKFHIARFFSQNGEKYLGPLLILIGLIMLNVIKFDFLGEWNFQERLSEKLKDKGLLGSFLIGVVFALAFCPYSGALFLFCNRMKNRLKILYYDRNGFCLWLKRLEKDKFPWPMTEEEIMELDYQKLKWLLSGIDFFHAHKELKFSSMI